MFTLLFALAACAGSADDTGGTTPVDWSGGDAAAGETLFAGTCEGCHGATGDLGTDINGTPAADLNVVVNSLSDADIADQIQNGGTAMPAQGMDDTETKDVIAYLHATFDN